MIKELNHLSKEQINLFIERGLQIAKSFDCPSGYDLDDFYIGEKCKTGEKEGQCEKCWKQALK